MIATSSPSVPRLGLALGLAAALAAQQPTPDPAAIGRDASGIAVDERGVTAVGADYKARLERGGLEFVPALGAAAPHNRPLRLAFRSASRGAAPLPAGGGAPRVEGRVVLYDHGASIQERFEVRPRGLAHSFVLRSRPAGSGDLVVRLAVGTDLECRPTAAARDGLAFRCEFGGVDVGAVVGIDAGGVEAAGSLRYDGAHLDYVLPAAFVDDARYPLLVDPIISAVFTVGARPSPRDRDPDVAYENTIDRYLVVWERAYSTTDADILGQMVTVAGALDGAMQLFATTTAIEMNPAVAGLHGDNSFVAVWQQSTSPFGPWEIHARGIGSTGTMTPDFTLATSAAGPANPDIGATVTPIFYEDALVVWETDAGIVGRRVEIDNFGRLDTSPEFALTNDPSDRNVDISRTAGAGQHYMLSWERGASGVWVAALNDVGGVLDTLDISTVSFQARPSVDGDGEDFLVAWHEPESFGSAKDDVRCRALSIDWMGNIVAASSPVDVDAQPNDDQFDAEVAFLGNEFIVTWVDEEGTFNFNVYSQTFTRGAQPSGLRHLISFGSLANFEPAVASRYEGGTPERYMAASQLDQACVVFAGGNGQPPFDTDVRARLFEAVGSGGAVAVVAPGCGAGGTIGVGNRFGIISNNPFAVGNEAFAIVLQGAPSAPLFFLALGITGTTPHVCGSCSLVRGSYYAAFPLLPGQTAYQLPIPAAPQLLGASIEAQWFHFGQSPGLCPLLPDLSTSERLRLTLGS